METKHTPGPWRAIHDPGHSSGRMVDNGGYRIDADGVEQLAYVWVLNHRVPTNGDPQESGPRFGAVQAGANARLIVAAPKMLEALDVCRIALKNRDQTPAEARLLAAISEIIAEAT